MAAAIQLGVQRRRWAIGPDAGANDLVPAVMPIEVCDHPEPRKELPLKSSFPSIHRDVDCGAVEYLSTRIGVPEKGVTAFGYRLTARHGPEKQECEGDRARLTQRALLSTEVLRMRPPSRPDAPGIGIYVSVLLEIYSVIYSCYKYIGYSETGILFFALSNYEGMFSSGCS